MRLSVVIPTRNRYWNVKEVLAALVLQTLPKDEFEVIVSDDNSDDATWSIINDFRRELNLKYIFSNIPKPHTWNASVVRNLGAVAADPSTQAFYFVDSDVILPPEALANIVEDLEKDPNRVIIGPYDFYQEGNEQVASKDVRSDKFNSVSVDETFETVHDGLAAFGGNLVIPKDTYFKVGGYDPQTFIGLEDGELGIRLWKLGAKFSYDKRNWGKHLWHQSPPDRFPPDMKAHIDKLNLKHFGSIDPDYGIIEVSRETYAQWGVDKAWNPPPEWGIGEKNDKS